MHIMKKMNREKKAFTEAEYRKLTADGYQDVTPAPSQQSDEAEEQPDEEKEQPDNAEKQPAKTAKKDNKKQV